MLARTDTTFPKSLPWLSVLISIGVELMPASTLEFVSPHSQTWPVLSMATPVCSPPATSTTLRFEGIKTLVSGKGVLLTFGPAPRSLIAPWL